MTSSVGANSCVVKARSWMAPHPATGNPVQVVSGMDYWDLLRRYEALIAEATPPTAQDKTDMAKLAEEKNWP